MIANPMNDPSRDSRDNDQSAHATFRLPNGRSSSVNSDFQDLSTMGGAPNKLRPSAISYSDRYSVQGVVDVSYDDAISNSRRGVDPTHRLDVEMAGFSQATPTREPTHYPSKPRSITRRFSGAADVDALFQYILKFSGVVRPTSPLSMWWLSWIGWRILVCLSLLLLALTFQSKPLVAQLWFFIPLFFANLAAVYLWYWLPSALEDILSEGGAHMSIEHAKKAVKVPSVFISFWLLLGLFFAASRAYVTGRLMPVLFTLCIEIATTPVLGAVLLAFALDTTLAKIDVKFVVDAAIDRTLTCDMYLDVLDSVKKRERRWRRCLFGLVFTALHCTFGLVVSVGYVAHRSNSNSERNNDDELGIFYSNSEGSDILLSIIVASELAKEVVLLFVLLCLVMGVNDQADALTYVLISGRWGEPSDPSEVVRAHLLFLNTVYSTPPRKLDNWYNFFTKSDKRPISFMVFGMRITRSFVVAALLSLILALANSLSRFVSTPTS